MAPPDLHPRSHFINGYSAHDWNIEWLSYRKFLFWWWNQIALLQISSGAQYCELVRSRLFHVRIIILYSRFDVWAYKHLWNGFLSPYMSGWCVHSILCHPDERRYKRYMRMLHNVNYFHGHLMQSSPRWSRLANTLLWRHNGHDCVPNHQPHHCSLNCLFGCRSQKTSKLRVTGLCVGNRGPVNSPHKWPVTRKMFPFDDVIMYFPTLRMN